MNDVVSPENSEILTQLSSGPSVREVASATLRQALDEMYPELEINPDLATVYQPQWYPVDDTILPGKPHTETLTSALARSAFSGEPVTYLDREHYLAYRSTGKPQAHLPVRIDAIARLINELAPLMFVAYQEQQMEFWNQSDGRGPRWRALAQALRNAWNVQEVDGWDADDCAIARTVFHYPDYVERQPRDKYGTRAYLVDIDMQDGAANQHINVTAVAVLIASHGDRSIILSYSIIDGYRKFVDTQALGESLQACIGNSSGETLNWRLLEPDGDFFEHQACSLIGLQVEAIGSLGFLTAEPQDLLSLKEGSTEAAQLLRLDQSHMGHIRRALPQWLLQASQADQSAYGRYMIDLANQNARDEGKTFMDGLPTITDFTRQALKALLTRDHPEATGLDPEHIVITVTSQVIWGTVTIPGRTQTETFSLVELALQNLIALPLGNKTVSYKSGRPTPAWLTPTYVEQLVTQANIGQSYPAQVNTQLLTNTEQALKRQQLYRGQLRLQLPLLALQYKIRDQFNIDEQGYRYVRAAMATHAQERRVDGDEVVIRPLALRPKWRVLGGADTVDNMFIIGPQEPKNGPCLLYRPLSDAPLMQFPSLANLLYAIKQDTPLRQSVLAWLPEAVRSDYAQFVFPGSVPSPWILPTLLSEPVSSLVMSGPIEFSTQALSTDPFTELYNANARALVTLADRQSVSNAEARWESLKHAGWLILNNALPFLGRTVGAAAWIWQIMDDIQHIIDAEASGDRPASTSALVDAFLTLGLVLALQISLQHAPTRTLEKPALAPEPPLRRKPVFIQKPTVSTADLTPTHEPILRSSGALTRGRLSLAKLLDSFSLPKPEGLAAQTVTPGPHLHLYAKGQAWYAPVGERWFEVTIDENDAVMIIDPKDPRREGPSLINNRLGQWFVDTRLRLRGGGLRSRRKKGERLRPPKIHELREQLEAFDSRTMQRREQIIESQRAIDAATPADREAASTAFLTQVSTRLSELDVPIAQLKSLNLLDSVPNYQEAMLEYLDEQMILARSATAEQLERFQESLNTASQFLDDPEPSDTQAALEDCRAIDLQAQDLINRFSDLHSRFNEARALGEKGVMRAQHNEKLLPKIELENLKAFRITLSRFLCIKENAPAGSAAARAVVNQIVEKTELAVQSLCETLQPDTPVPLDDQIEALDSLVEQFTSLDQSLADLPADFPDDVHRPALGDLRALTEEFSQRAVKRLTALLRQRKAWESHVAGPSRPVPRPQKKVIKTRFQGVVVGEERAPLSGESTPLVEVKQPLTGKVIALFHEKEPGVWVEHERPSAPSTHTMPRTVSAAIASGQTLLDEMEPFIERTKGLASDTRRLPVEIEERFHRQIKQLEQAGRDIEEALTASNLTESGAPSAALINRNLDTAVKRLYDEGRRLKLTMLKQRPPTAAHVELLYREKEIVIKPLPGSRSKLSGRNKGYLKEYEILDTQSSNALWYAHFHYKELVGPEEAYTAAHLKTKAQRRLGGKYQTPTRTDDHESIAVYRSEIGPHLARLLFFTQPAPSVPAP